jgi:FAD/FMN-containing dehydrogenase
MREMLGLIRHSGEGSFLTVLKTYGDIPSPGMLSFPRPGLTLALDFAYRGHQTLQLLHELDKIVIQSGGAVYPAKDARMSAQSFQTFYPQWKQFAQHIDPHFSSSFWRRVTRPTQTNPWEPIMRINTNIQSSVGADYEF